MLVKTKKDFLNQPINNIMNWIGEMFGGSDLGIYENAIRFYISLVGEKSVLAKKKEVVINLHII